MMKEEDNTRIGIIGTGDISRAFIKNANILNCNVTSVLSRNIQKAKDFANDYHIQNAYDNFEQFIKEINIVYVATPNHTHYQYARKALLKCKHVLLEKPFTLNVEEAKELFYIAEENKVFILEVDRVNFLPNYEIIRKSINNPELINIAFCKRSRRYDDYLKGLKPHLFDAKCGGGSLNDLGVYTLHFIVGLFDKIEDFKYECVEDNYGVDLYGVIKLKSNKTIININLSKINGPYTGLKILDKVQIESNYPVSRLDTITVNNICYKHDYENFYYFIKEALRIISEKDKKVYINQMNKTIRVLELMTNLKK